MIDRSIDIDSTDRPQTTRGTRTYVVCFFLTHTYIHTYIRMKNERTNEKKNGTTPCPVLVCYYDYDYNFGLFTFISSRSYDDTYYIWVDVLHRKHTPPRRMNVRGWRSDITNHCRWFRWTNSFSERWVRKEGDLIDDDIDDDGRTPARTRTCLWEPRNPTVPPIPVRVPSQDSQVHAVVQASVSHKHNASKRQTEYMWRVRHVFEQCTRVRIIACGGGN